MNFINSHTPSRNGLPRRSRAIVGLGLLWLTLPARAQPPTAPHLVIQLTNSAQLRLVLSGVAGETYQFEISSNLVNWVPLATTNSVTSNVVVMASEAGGSTSQFFRALDLGPATGGGPPNAEFTLLWPAASSASVPHPLSLTPAGSVVFALQDANSLAATNSNGQAVGPQTVNLSLNTNEAAVTFSGLATGDYTVVAEVYPEPNGSGVPFEEARFFFSVTGGGSPVTQTFTLADNTVTHLVITPPTPTVAAGGTLQLSATTLDASNEVVFVAAQSGALTWSSLDTAAATVDFTGKLTGVQAPASDTIFVTERADPAITTNVQITVSNEIAGLTISPSPFVVVGVGEETNLTAAATNSIGTPVPLAASALTWTFSAPSNAVYATVDGAGTVAGVAPGLENITLTVKNVAATATTVANVSIGGPGNAADGVPPPTSGYTITDLGVLQNNPGYLSSVPAAINDYGHVAGTTWESLSPTNDTTTEQAFIWKTSLNGQMTDLPDLGGGQAEATGINDSDEVAGWSIKPVTISSTKQYNHAVLWKNGKVTDLNKQMPAPTSPPWPPPGYFSYDVPNFSDAFRINDESQVIGAAADETTNSTPWSSGFLFDLEQTNVTYLWAALNPQTEPLPTPEALNDAGEMAGGQFVFSGYSASYAYAFVGQVAQVTSDQVAPLANLPGYQSGIADSINNLGQVAGLCSPTPSTVPQFVQPRAVAWRDSAANFNGTGQATDLGTDGNFSRAGSINDLGTVVGDSWPSVGSEFTDAHAVLWAGTNAYDLNAYIPTNSGWDLHVASAINDKGQIVGQGTVTGELGYHSFLLTPNH